MVLLPNQIGRLVHPRRARFGLVDHGQRVVSFPLAMCSVTSGNPEVTAFVQANVFMSSTLSNNWARGSNLPKKFEIPSYILLEVDCVGD